MSDPSPGRKIRRDEVVVPSTDVSVYEAIHRRRMAKSFSDREVPRAALERMLDAAVWAPNHGLTEPWRFFVLAKDGAARGAAAELAYAFIRDGGGDEQRAELARQKVLSPPVALYLFAVPGPDYETTLENYAAVCCAAQNLCLAALAEGLGVGWSTGAAARSPGLAVALGGEADWLTVGLLSIGFADKTANSPRTVEASVRWLE